MTAFDLEKIRLQGDYYNHCHSIFRSQTDQQGLMLASLLKACVGKSALRILSVGSGKGLFEKPLIEKLTQANQIAAFTGIDLNLSANDFFRSTMKTQDFDFSILDQSFEDFQPSDKFDIVLFNHMFEYLEEGHQHWLSKALELLQPQGFIALFSPLDDEINHHYAQFQERYFSRRPYFAHDIEKLLEQRSDLHSHHSIIPGQINLTLLSNESSEEERIALLSFLCQIDLRALPAKEIEDVSQYFLSQSSGQVMPHRTQFFIINSVD